MQYIESRLEEKELLYSNGVENADHWRKVWLEI